MDRDTAKKLLPIISAFAEGEEVEILEKRTGKWVAATNPGFSHAPDMYRIKPVPKEIWVNEYPDGHYAVHDSQDKARMYVNNDRIVREAIRYREVLDE